MRCESREPGQLPRIGPPAPAPLRNGLPFAWEGECARKPWQYDVAAMIPVLDSVEALPLIIELLRLQTVRPYILLVDTGSSPENFAQVEALRADDVEVHALRLNGFEHSSQSVAMAIDAAMAVCQSRFLFLSHSDCFLRSRTVLEEFAELAQDHPVVGYQITPRPHQDWRGMVGHTATMLDMHEMHRHGLSWNLRRMCAAFGLTPKTHADRPGWPDTELGFYYACRDAGIEPLIVGQEENHVRTLDARIDHCRSVASMEFYSGSYARKAEWEDAMKSAAERVAAWQAEPVTATSREWRQRAFVPKPLPEFRREWTR